jgi:hypothetical protein
MNLPDQSLERLLARRAGLERLLDAHAELWRPVPFHEPAPAWCARHTALAAHWLALSDARVAALADDNRALIADLAGFVPALSELAELIALPRLTQSLSLDSPHLGRHIPGRKQSQIEAFAGALGPVAGPVLEWCSGKGHLGRLLAGRWRQPVLSLELDRQLCGDGQALAERAGAPQNFQPGDALAPSSAPLLAGRHAVALHACGDLHLALLRGAVAQLPPAVDLAPCCYYRIASPEYRPLNADAGLRLTRDELHLAVTETATAGARDRRLRDRAQAWKLAFLEWRASAGVPRGVTFKPVPSGWYGVAFGDWLARLAEREGLPAPVDAGAWEATGWGRLARVRRLELARLAFRRPLEIWLVLDRALYLARHGYRVGLAEFCDRDLTPRNLLISARRGGC